MVQSLSIRVCSFSCGRMQRVFGTSPHPTYVCAFASGMYYLASSSSKHLLHNYLLSNRNKVELGFIVCALSSCPQAGNTRHGSRDNAAPSSRELNHFTSSMRQCTPYFQMLILILTSQGLFFFFFLPSF